MVWMKFSTEILSLNPWNRFVSFFVIKAGVNLEDVNIMKKNCQASLPVDLGHKMLIVLRIRVGYEGARSNMAFREHLVFFWSDNFIWNPPEEQHLQWLGRPWCRCHREISEVGRSCSRFWRSQLCRHQSPPWMDQRSFWHNKDWTCHAPGHLPPSLLDESCGWQWPVSKDTTILNKDVEKITSAKLGITFSLNPALNIVTAVVVLWIASVS